MLTQHYKFPVTLEHIKEAKPGQFVFESNDSDKIIGFVDFVSDTHIAFMLFDPTEISYKDAINISDNVDWEARLKEIITEDPEIAEIWEEIEWNIVH